MNSKEDSGSIICVSPSRFNRGAVSEGEASISAQPFEDLIAMLFHDLRAPLANIESSLDLLLKLIPETGSDEAHNLLNIAVSSTKRIQRLTSMLLDINRLEAGHLVGKRQLTSPSRWISDAIDAVLPIALAKEQDLSWDIPPDLPDLNACGEMILRVLINLLENAVKFTPPQGKIHITVQEQKDRVVFCVSDTGPGILLEDQEIIFNKYSKIGECEGPRGFGLGLAYCRLAVREHGGEIWVESEPGQGSQFIFAIPNVN